MYTDPVDRYLYDEPKEEEGDARASSPPKEGLYEPMESKESLV